MTKDKINHSLREAEPEYCELLDRMSRDNPFYSNHVFTDKDLQRKVLKIDLWERFWLIFRPTLVQLSGGYVFHYKTMWGRYYLIKEEVVTEAVGCNDCADITLYGGARGGGTKGFSQEKE